MEILDILSRESEVSSNAYIYEENGHWYAYENSAFLLKDLLKGVLTVQKFINDIYDLALHKVEVDLAWLSRCCITSCSDTELVIAATTGASGK